MLIGLLSDTHIPEHASELPSQLGEVFRGVDLILHAGDVYAVSVLYELEALAPVLVARGDDDQEVAGDSRCKMKHVLTVEGVTIWLTHEKPWSWHNEHEQLPHVSVFGHAHEASVAFSSVSSHTADGSWQSIILINPGSPTFPNYQRQLGTVGLLTVNSGKAKVQIVQL